MRKIYLVERCPCILVHSMGSFLRSIWPIFFVFTITKLLTLHPKQKFDISINKIFMVLLTDNHMYAFNLCLNLLCYGQKSLSSRCYCGIGNQIRLVEDSFCTTWYLIQLAIRSCFCVHVNQDCYGIGSFTISILILLKHTSKFTFSICTLIIWIVYNILLVKISC